MTQDTPMSSQTTHPKGSILPRIMKNGTPFRFTLLIDTKLGEISLIRPIKIFATILLLLRADLILWGFLDAF